MDGVWEGGNRVGGVGWGGFVNEQLIFNDAIHQTKWNQGRGSQGKRLVR